MKTKICIFTLLLIVNNAQGQQLPNGFVYLKDFIPDIVVELRYSTNFNFLGVRVDGYENNKCIMTRDAAEALKKVQNELRVMGLGLKLSLIHI